MGVKTGVITNADSRIRECLLPLLAITSLRTDLSCSLYVSSFLRFFPILHTHHVSRHTCLSLAVQVLSSLNLPTHLSSFSSPTPIPTPPTHTPHPPDTQETGTQQQPLILVSELLGIEKPSPRIFERACELAGVKLGEGLHVGDEVDACVHLLVSLHCTFFLDVVDLRRSCNLRDYLGARHSPSSPQSTGLGGMHALLLLRPTHDRPTQPSDEDMGKLVERGVRREDVVCGMEEVVRRVREVNGNGS